MIDADIKVISKSMLPNYVDDFLRSFPDELWYCGNINLLQKPIITIVGTRKPSSYGIQLVSHLTERLSLYDIATVSGLAFGIDTLVHEQSILNEIPTIAIPGSGLGKSVLYPRGNIEMAEKILKHHGLLLSPFPIDRRAEKYFFPVRNCLMAAISNVVIVIEAQERSGSLITAHHALEYGKPTYVFPGSYFSPLSRGCHQLINEGACVLSSFEDFVSDLGFPLKKSENTKSVTNMTLDIFDAPKTLTELCEYFYLQPTDMLVQLTLMEFEGKIINMGGRYQKSRQ
ncbi:MAG TPA: DNA-processing protein DprA [Candidatus Paceibacterota bacterium]